MVSHCLKHQERVASHRCVACSIPLCELCTQQYDDGVYCSDNCYQSAQTGKVRAAAMAKQDAELKKRQQTQAAIKTIVYVVLGFGLFFGWEYLPEGFTSMVETMWAKLKGLGKK